MDLANCVQCGKLYARTIRDICPACVKELEQQYEKVLAYLREHRGANLKEVSEATGVPEKLIIRFIREGRISVIHATNLSYPCEICGAEIKEGNICDSCRQRLAKDLANSIEDQQQREELARAKEQRAFKISDRLQNRLKQ